MGVPVHPDVLIVEDDPAIQSMVSRCLRLEGIPFLLARDLPEADGFLEGPPLRVILLDYHLPSGKGPSLLPRIQSLQPQARVVLMSGVGDQEQVGDVAQGFHGHLPKPFKVEDLLCIASGRS